ncbi:MAG: amino acid transporter [Smithella sp. SDB]|nr:MAG: amino acid transporter [Smithella sp. SDB]
MDNNKSHQSLFERIKYRFIGAPRDINEPSIFHKISLIPILAWIGLGADGLSSSSYGPEEAFKALGPHTYLAIFIAIATAFTIFVIAFAYSRIIERFPHGGGGYMVSTHTIGSNAGVVSGSALLVDYILTITISLAACGDAVFSYLPANFLPYKLPFVMGLIILLVFLNLRGVKESVTFLAPIFITFVITHILLIGYGLFTHAGEFGTVAQRYQGNISTDLSTIGFLGIMAIFLRAFSMGGGTYTGIEAVSTSMHIMREPKVQTGKRTMLYLAVSLAVTASGLLLCYALFDIKPIIGQTLNATLANQTFSGWYLGGALAFVTILSEGALLMVGAQSGFAGGPSIMANMAKDSWFPRRFSALSERLTMQNGVLLMGVTSIAVLLYTKGSVTALVVMYSINVFLDFTLSQFGMAKFFFQNRKKDNTWANRIVIHIIGFILCFTILIVTIYEKFGEGGWVTLVITSTLIGLCYLIRGHYLKVRKGIRQLEEILSLIPAGQIPNEDPANPNERTAIFLVSGYNGFGLHSWLSVFREFPKLYRNFIFVSVAEIDSGAFKGVSEIEALKTSIKEQLAQYVKIARSYGYAADYRMDVATDVVEAATQLCEDIVREFPKSTVFTGKLVFRQETIFQRILHNETAFAIQRRLQWEGITAVILPIRVNI